MRLALVFVVVAAVLSCAEASRFLSSRRVGLGVRAGARARASLGAAAAAAVQTTAQSGVSFVFSGKKTDLDVDVATIFERANKAHTVTGPTSAGTIGKRLNNAGTPKQFAAVHVEVETVTSATGVVSPRKAGTTTAATDADWAAFAAASTKACGENDFDVFMVAHRTNGATNPFLWKRGAMHGSYMDATYLWTNFVKHVDKRTKRVIVCACYGWLGRAQFATAVANWNRDNPAAQWDPLFIANEQPMSLTEDGEWSTMTEAAIAALKPGEVLDMTKLSQTISMKDMHVMKGGAEVSPFPNVPLATVQRFQGCRRTSVDQGVAADRGFAKSILVDPSAVTVKQVEDAIASIPACQPAPAAPIKK